MQWLRLYHDTITDMKWRVVSNESGEPVGNVLAVWMQMLINASAAEDRGTLEGWNDKYVAAHLGYPTDAVTAIREAMQGVVLDGDVLTGWEKRQRASDDAGGRQRKTRERREPKPPSGGGHGGNGHDPEHPATVARQTESVARQTDDVARQPLRAQTPDLQKESKGESVCEVGVDPREAHTQGAPEFSETKSANVVQFAPQGGRQPVTVGWVLPAPYRAYAEAAGQTNIDGAARRFAVHWSGRGAKTEAEWRQAWENWIDENIERGYGNGKQRHDHQQRRGHGDLASYVKPRCAGWLADAAGGSDPW